MKKIIFLFFISVFVPYLNIYELTFGVWTLTALFTLQKKYSVEIIKHLACYIIIFIIAFVSSFRYNHQLYYIIRDITYISKPIIGLLIGYQLTKKMGINALKVVVKTAFIIAIYHIYLLLYSILFHKVIGINEVRFYAGFFSDFEVYGLILLLFHEKFKSSAWQERF